MPSVYPSTAVIGAGLSGLACATQLQQAGYPVTIFDKGRGPGGRLSTRRMPIGSFDHGAQYFSVRDPIFREQVALWLDSGHVARWQGRVVNLERGVLSALPDQVERFVGMPSMSAMTRQLSASLMVRSATRVAAVNASAQGWRLSDDKGQALGRFDRVVLSMPAPQSAALLSEHPAMRAQLEAVVMHPCWAVMLAFAEPLQTPFEAAFVKQSPLAWIARDSAKPGRSPGERWVLHASSAWSLDHLELDRTDVANRLWPAMVEAIGRNLPPIIDLAAHRWRFARPEPALNVPFLWDAERRIGVCGDGCLGPRVEAAYVSGHTLGKKLVAHA